MIPRLFFAALLACVAAFPALAQEGPPANLDERATTLFETSYRDYCDTIGYTSDLPMDRMEKFEFSYLPTAGAESGPKNILVYRFFCAHGSYYMEHVYFWWRESDGLQPLLFSKPTFKTKFENDDETGKLLSIDVTGFTSQAIMVNSEVDVVAGTISEDALWGGLGDASSHGTWVLDGGDFRLTKFAVDPSFDGKENPVVVLEYPNP